MSEPYCCHVDSGMSGDLPCSAKAVFEMETENPGEPYDNVHACAAHVGGFVSPDHPTRIVPLASKPKPRAERDPSTPLAAEHLTFAAFSRCPCGAGLAYERRALAVRGFWDCSAILLGTATPTGQPGAVTHTDRLPFAFYEIKSENQPSANGATTRNKA